MQKFQSGWRTKARRNTRPLAAERPAPNKLHTHPLPAVMPDKAGWYKTTLSREGGRGGGGSLLQAKGFTWIPLVGQILVLVPRFDREFAMTFQRHVYCAAKMAADLNSTLCSANACVLINELLRE